MAYNDVYKQGFTLGKSHAELNFPAMSDRTWSISFRNGYSDGYAYGKERI